MHKSDDVKKLSKSSVVSNQKRTIIQKQASMKENMKDLS